jgi:hypothetical protein
MGAVGVVLLLLCFAGGPTAQAQQFGRNKVVYDDFDFQQIQTEHFDVYYYPPMEPAAQDAARMAERWYGRLSRVFQHELLGRIPIIFYADDTDFQQTNVIGGFIGEGTGGVTEGGRQRLIMPFTGAYGETDRILGHELVHVFQYDIWKQNPRTFQLGALPLWLIEGTAEYLSSGRQDPHTGMWMREAVRTEDIPTTRQLTREQNQYFPYRYGQALMAYVGGNYGDQALGILYRQAGFSGVDQAIQEVLGVTAEELSASWAESQRETYEAPLAERTPPSEVGQRLLSRETTGGRMNFSPAISPDGRYVAFFSERGLFSVDLYVADTETGEVIRRLTKSGTSSHFDAVRFISSAGSWAPDGRRLAFVTFRQGNNQIAILNARTERIETRYRVEAVGGINNPAWGPDGRRIAFSGNTGGVTNLYVLDTQSGDVRQLTDDRTAALQPAWSPDGERLAYVTDRGPGTDFSRLSFGEMRIGLLDVSSGDTRVLPLFEDARHINPQFSPDGRRLYFVADPDGYSDVYRYDFEDEQLARMTRLATGVSGITSLSPALSVARQSGDLVFSVYESDGYSIHGLDLDEREGTPVERAANPARADVSLPPTEATDQPGLVSGYLGDPSGLPEQTSFEDRPYRPRLHLDYIGVQGGVGVGYTSGVDRFNTQIGGGVGFLWNDLMGDHTLYSVVQANGTVKDIGGGVSYLNRSGRLQWGASVSHTPIRSGSWNVRREPFKIGDQVFTSTRIDQILQRTFVDQVAGNVAYPLNVNQRLEASLGYTRLSYDFEIETTRVIGNQIIERDRTSVRAPDGLNLIDLTTAFVGDYSIQGFTGPIQGRRYRLEVGSQFGDLFYQTVLGDYRQYLFVRPVTLAFRGLHFGRYGPDGEDGRLTPQFLGNGTLIRGYSFFSFDPEECGTSPGSCPVFDRLIGSRTAVASAEVRLPVLGVRELGLISFPYLPTELIAFADGGVAWSSDEAPTFAFDRDSSERIPVFSTGLGTRVNVLGALILELSYAYPFQRPDRGWHFDFQISPGW